MHFAHGGRGEPGVQLLTVEASHVGGVEVLEPEASQRRDYVGLDHVPMHFEGARAHGAPHGVLQPPCKVLPKGESPRVEVEPLSTVAHSLDELGMHFVAGLTGDVAALWAEGRIHSVST